RNPAFHMTAERFDACLETRHCLCSYSKILEHYRKIGNRLLFPGCDEKGNMIVFRGGGETFHIGKQFVRRSAHRADHNNEFLAQNCPVPEGPRNFSDLIKISNCSTAKFQNTVFHMSSCHRRHSLNKKTSPAECRTCYQFIYKRSEEHTSELQSRFDLVCRLLLEKKKVINS